MSVTVRQNHKIKTTFGEGSLTFREFIMREPIPLATIHEAVLEFLCARQDAVLFGAYAVNAYVDEPRMTQDIDILSVRAAEFARELREFLSKRFHFAVRIREVGDGRGYRLFQLQKPRNRHLVDVRAVAALPHAKTIGRVRVMAPEELIAAKVIAFCGRTGNPKAFSDRRDLAVLLLRFPKLKSATGPVRDCLDAAGAEGATLDAWLAIVREKLKRPRDQDEFS